MVMQVIAGVALALVVIFAREIHDSLLRPLVLLLMRLSIWRQIRRARKQLDQDADAAQQVPANVEEQRARMRAKAAERARSRRRMRKVSIRANRRRAAARRSRGHDKAPVLVRRIIAAAPTRKRAA